MPPRFCGLQIGVSVPPNGLNPPKMAPLVEADQALVLSSLSSQGPPGPALGFYRVRVRRLYIAHFDCKGELGSTKHGTFHLPLPPLPPTIRYSFLSLSSLEAEHLVVRALAAEANWRSTMPKAYNAWRFSEYADEMSMKIVPGGKYVIASVREETNRYALMLFMMEHRVKTAYPVAKIVTPSKAYKLEAKYMHYETEMGIMISYVRREPKRAPDRTAGRVILHPRWHYG